MTVFGGDEVYADDINQVAELLDSASVVVTTAVTPLTSTAGTDVVVTSLAYEFVQGYAYEISFSMRMQVNGSGGPYAVYSKVRRANAAGTVINDAGSAAQVGSNFAMLASRVLVKRTGATTTQTIAAVCAFVASGGATSLDLEASSTSPATLLIRPIGLASAHSGALEVPTS